MGKHRGPKRISRVRARQIPYCGICLITSGIVLVIVGLASLLSDRPGEIDPGTSGVCLIFGLLWTPIGLWNIISGLRAK